MAGLWKCLLRVFLVSVLAGCSIAQDTAASATVSPTVSPASPEAPPADAATVAPKTDTTTTTTTTTTTQATTTTTEATTTTTTTSPAPPNTTTTATTTTTTTTSGTTTTTATPVDPTPGRWSVSDDTNSNICILAHMGIQMKIPYLSWQNKTLTATINVPVNASADGSCDETEYVKLTWQDPMEPGSANTFTVTFSENATSGQYRLETITVTLTMTDTNFPDHSGSETSLLALVANLTEPIQLPVNNSYRCMSRQMYELVGSPEGAGQLTLLQTQLEAYRSFNTTQFSKPLICEADHAATSDVVPIAVGVALACLVVIILVAYVIGRRRAAQRGYQSV